MGLESIGFSLSKDGEKPLLNIKGTVLRLQSAKSGIMTKLILKIKSSCIPITDPNKILFSSSKVRDYFSKVVDDAKLKCTFELLEAGKPADPSGNKESKICFVALDQTHLEHAIGDLLVYAFLRHSYK